MKLQEKPLDAAVRGVKEELQLEIEKSRFTKTDEKVEERISDSYPTLKGLYIQHKFTLNLKEKEFQQEYTEDQKDSTGGKITTFIWQEKTK